MTDALPAEVLVGIYCRSIVLSQARVDLHERRPIETPDHPKTVVSSLGGGTT